MENLKPVIFSGMQATGVPSLGNYIGAIKNWVNLQAEYRCLFCVVDLHSITVRLDPTELREKSRDLFTLYIALGLDPEEHILYYQSHVPGHAELAWMLSCYTYMGELNRMTQFKDKSQKNEDNINAGLYTYPVLMAADILLFNTDVVPVGHDQKQHLELCRDVATRFNNRYGEVFKVPEPYIAPIGSRIMSLQEPEKKMSKSESINLNNVIHLLDEPNAIMKKFKRAMTDSLNEIKYDPVNQPGVSNLLTIYACATDQTIENAVTDFADARGYGDLKTRVGESVVALFEPFQKRYAELKADQGYIDKLIKNNAQRAHEMSLGTLAAVKDAIGFPK
ncbi:MAG: tryptophan--tRNA ligase [Defluviitaleaceae bacterium]|nr:tryptophan--tRNA ligase [Defluviitaleaceae bacterium]